ncbi:MAG: hypothetical protein HYW57_00335 [Ignavibacteriales bacterium]|nr:hypothetical protein [Ignavibacteriales bacterium]
MLLQALSHRSLVRSVLVAVLLPSFLFPTLSQTRAPQERLTVAVLDFAGRGVKEDEAASLSDVFQGVLV